MQKTPKKAGTSSYPVILSSLPASSISHYFDEVASSWDCPHLSLMGENLYGRENVCVLSKHEVPEFYSKMAEGKDSRTFMDRICARIEKVIAKAAE